MEEKGSRAATHPMNGSRTRGDSNAISICQRRPLQPQKDWVAETDGLKMRTRIKPSFVAGLFYHFLVVGATDSPPLRYRTKVVWNEGSHRFHVCFMPIFPVNPTELVVGLLCFQVVGRLVCGQAVLFKFGVESDGEEGPDDGTNHVHPEEVFNFDCKVNPFCECAYH